MSYVIYTLYYTQKSFSVFLVWFIAARCKGFYSYVSFRATRIRLSSTTTLLLLVVTKNLPPTSRIFVVIHKVECHGWQVEVGHLGNPMRLNEQHQLIDQGLRWQTTPYVPFSAVATILVLFLPSSWQECQEDATDSAGTSQARNSPNQKKTS